MQDDVVISAHHQARVRIEQLLGQAIDGVESVRRSGRAVEPRVVSQASTVAAQAAGFVEACTLLAPDLVMPEQERLETLGAAIASIGAAFVSTPPPASALPSAGSMAEISSLPRAFMGGDRRTSPRPDEVPRRAMIRRVLPDRRLTERRTLPDRRAVL
ncbi:MAG TPA: hypothetical protein VFB69_04885 [Candidatus Dormibacteraeota bacterium]|nr:hypothetical protein [Candidatus Dormibacteraeota bacterium]